MGQIKDLTGQRFGRLTVLQDSGQRKNRQVVWKCQCDCGNITYVVGQALRTGHTQSCGCYQKIKAAKNAKDLTGQRFGKLVVLQRYGSDKERRATWLCQCDCGNQIIASSKALLSGRTLHCGCQHKKSRGELKIDQILRENQISFSTEVSFQDLPCKKKGKSAYDFGILNENNEVIRLIEYDGIQHFQPIEEFGGEEGLKSTQNRDKIKNAYAKNHNIPLVRIPYTEYNNLDLSLIMGDKYLV